MNKAELVQKIAEKSDLKKSEAEAALVAFTETVTETLSDGDKVVIVGFGTFQVRDRKARKGRNPQDPSIEIDIPASKAATFKPGKNLKEAINE